MIMTPPTRTTSSTSPSAPRSPESPDSPPNSKTSPRSNTRQVRLERVVLAGIWNTTQAEAENSIRELAALAETAGSEVLDALIQRRDKPDPGTYLGKGKAAELADIVASVGADTVIIDSNSPPARGADSRTSSR